MKQPTAEHRPIHGGYPDDVTPWAPPPSAAGHELDPFRKLWGAPPAPGSVAALGFFDLDDRPPPAPITIGAELGRRVMAEIDAGATTVRIDAIDPADADYVPHDMLVIDGRPVADAVFSVEGDPDDWAAGDTRELSGAECEAIIASLADTDPRSLPREGESMREHAARLLRPTGVWLDEMSHWPDDAALAVLETNDRARRGTLTHPQREPRGVEPGFAFERDWL